jgi:hypothetical protein
VLQHLYLKKLNSSLFAKEQEDKSTDNTRITFTKGQVLNDKDLIEKLETAAQKRKRDELAKIEKRNARERTKKRRADNEARWAKAKSNYAIAKSQFEKELVEKKARGLKGADLPTAPKRPLRRDVEMGDEAGDDDGDAQPSGNQEIRDLDEFAQDESNIDLW